MELKQIFELQRNFDCKMGWNRYEKCNTLEDIINFMQYFVVVIVEELGEITRIRKKFQQSKIEIEEQGNSQNSITFLSS